MGNVSYSLHYLLKNSCCGYKCGGIKITTVVIAEKVKNTGGSKVRKT